MNKKEILGFFIAIIFGITAFFISPWIAENFATFGYLGVFLFSLITSATLLLPTPSWVLVLSLSTSFNPILLGIAAGIGAGLGELTGYFAGKGGNYIIHKDKIILLNNYKEWIKKAEFPFLFIVAFLPNPLFDIAGIAAGILGVPVQRFLFAVILGKTLRFILFAYFGVQILSTIS